MTTETLYRIYDRDGTLLYIGKTKRQLTRYDEHHTQPWWTQAHRIDLEHWTSDAIDQAERNAIIREQPLHNITYNRSATTTPPQNLQPRIQRIIQLLEQLDIPPHATTREAEQAIRDAGHQARSQHIRYACRQRRESTTAQP
jgi:hypothetical protein